MYFDSINEEGYDSTCLFIVNRSGYLEIVHCPFLVFLTKPIEGHLKKGYMDVDEVVTTKDEQLYFQINGDYYHYSHFIIAHDFFRNKVLK
jgi:hypothetical protein